MYSIQRTMSVHVITGFFKVIFIFFLLFDLSVLAERLLLQNEAEINSTPLMRHNKHNRNTNKDEHNNEEITNVYSKLRTNLRHRSHHHQNYHHTTTTMSPSGAGTSTTTKESSTTTTKTTTTPTTKTSFITTTRNVRPPEEHRLRHSNKFYQAFNLNYDYNHEKTNLRRYINQSSYPMSTPNNPWKILVSSSSASTTTQPNSNKKHHNYTKQFHTASARDFYNVSKLMQGRLFDRGEGSAVMVHSTRPPKIRHPYDVLKVPLQERVRIKPVRKSFDHNDLWDESRLWDDATDDVIDWSTKKRHLKFKSNRKGRKLQIDHDDYDEDYYEDEEEISSQNKNLDLDLLKDPDDIYSKSYIPGTLTKHKFEILGTRDAVGDSRQNYLSNQQKEQALASDHAKKMYADTICKWPKPKIVAVQNDPDKLYMPHCTILHRCGDDAGCCRTDSRTCAAKYYEHVDLYFYVKSMHQKSGTIEKRTFINHTECFCENKANIRSTRPDPMRSATVISCTCTKAFEQVLDTDGTCRCDCSSSNYACDWKKKGREHFSMEDRRCIMEGRCNPPTCEYGAYDKRHGRCPRKEDKLATGFSYHS